MDVAGEGSSISPRASTPSPATPLVDLEHHHRSNQDYPFINHINDSNSCEELTTFDTSVDVAGEGSNVSPRDSTPSPATPLVDLEKQPHSIQVLPPVANIKEDGSFTDLVSFDISTAEESLLDKDFSLAVYIMMGSDWLDEWEVSSASSEATARELTDVAEDYEDSEGVACRVQDKESTRSGDPSSSSSGSSSEGTVLTVARRQRSRIPRMIAADAIVTIVRKACDKNSDLLMCRVRTITAKCTTSEPETHNRLPAGGMEEQTTGANSTQTANKREAKLRFNEKIGSHTAVKNLAFGDRKNVGGRQKTNNTKRNATTISEKTQLTSKAAKPVWRW